MDSLKADRPAQVFKSGVSILPLLLILLLFNGIVIFSVSSHNNLVPFILLPLEMLILYALFSIRYTVTGHWLSIHTGIGKPFVIDIRSISKIEPTFNPLSAPAASLRRLEVSYNKYDSVLISPRDKKEFIERLLLINPEIMVVTPKK
jgi:hypothetical protein